MSDIAIQADTISKQYRIGQRQSYKALRDTVSEAMAAPLRRVRSSLTGVTTKPSTPETTIWALQDVSFQLRQGEVVGLIGRNGSGKSTLLKILSRITKPTSGQAMIAGRVGSLLEVGTGFHPELTGGENVYLNGAILGMKRAEISRQFDAIVAFAEIDQFIGTPVKRYSSGMYMRLAFAVAAHLETEILLVDEVLAVGDAAFQKKCLGKISDVAREGRTVVFVSHTMAAVQQLCTRVLLMRAGILHDEGSPDRIIANYLSDASQSEDGDFDLSNHPARSTEFPPLLRRLILRGSDGSPTSLYYPGDGMHVELTIRPQSAIREPRIAIAIEDSSGQRIMTFASHFHNGELPDITAECQILCTVPPLQLGSGRYLISASVGTKYRPLIDAIDNAAWFEVGWHNNYGNGEPYLPIYGPILTQSRWARIG
jgi:lipopolysaccharide transport system ATP-binding protein